MLWLGLVIGLTTLFAPLASAQGTDRPPDTMEARLRACAACHGDQGQGTDNDYFPRLAGKPAGYLKNQLVAFRDGRRRYAPMNYLLEYQNEAYLQKIAEYFSALRPPPTPPAVTDVSAAVLDRGKTLVIDGDQAHSVPACAGCHGPKLTGMVPGIPGLVEHPILCGRDLVAAYDQRPGVALGDRPGLGEREARRTLARRFPGQDQFLDPGSLGLEGDAEACQQLAPVAGSGSQDQRRRTAHVGT